MTATPYRITKVWIEEGQTDGTFEITPDGDFFSVHTPTGGWDGVHYERLNPPEAVACAIEDLFSDQQEASA